MTLGACAVKDTRGHRIVLRCSLAEALQSSSPVTSRKLVNYADQRSKFENQFPSDPTLTRDKQVCGRPNSVTGTGGPPEAQRGLCHPCAGGRRRGRLGKLTTRFLLPSCDLEAINKLTLAATPTPLHPTYAQVVRVAMATGVGDGAGERGYGAGRGGGRAGGGGGVARGGRHGYGAAHGYQEVDNDAAFNAPRFNPNLGVHPLNYGPG